MGNVLRSKDVHGNMTKVVFPITHYPLRITELTCAA